MSRPDGWEGRLESIISDSREKQFHHRTWNCARFAHDCVEAVTGREINYAWRGSLEASADAVFLRISPKAAQRGDLVLARVPDETLGICIGREAMFIAQRGVIRFPMRDVMLAWRVQ